MKIRDREQVFQKMMDGHKPFSDEQLTEKQLLELNEELYNVNNSYQETIRELVNANADFDNLLMCAEIGALYIDKELKIRKITPIMGKNTNLRLADTGCFITQVDFMDEYHDLVKDVMECRDQGCNIEREVVREGVTWLLRLCPYYSSEGQVDGVLVTLFDITKRLEATKYELQVLNNSIPGGVAKMRFDEGLILEYANDALYKMLNLTKKEVFEKYRNHYERVLYEEDWEKLNRLIKKKIKSGGVVQMEYRVRVNKRPDEWRMIQARVLEQRDGKPVLQCFITNITSQKEVQFQLEEQRKKMSAILEMSGDLIFEYDIAQDCMTYSRPGEGILLTEQLTENYVATIRQNSVFEEQEEAIRLSEALLSGAENIHVELRRIGTDGHYHWVETAGRTIYSKVGKPEKVLGKVRYIDEQKSREEELKRKSQRDSLTGLLNQGTIRHLIEQRLERWTRGRIGYLIVCDIDEFKQVNDLNGHLFGDAVLCSFADEMTNLLPEALTGRIGGDEFILFVEEESLEELKRKLVYLNRALTDRFRDDATETTISCSLGVVVVDGRVKDYEVLFQWADSALYQVKNSGKGSYRILEVEMDSVPDKSYLADRNNENDYVRKEALIRNEDDLALLSMELLENVADIRSALKLICDRTCRFYDFDDMVCVEHLETENHVIYQWSRKEQREYTDRMQNQEIYNWEKLCSGADEQGVRIYTKEQTKDIETEEAQSLLVVLSRGYKDFHASIVFSDRSCNHEWEGQKTALAKLAGHIFSRLHQHRMEEQEKADLDYKLNYDELTGLLQYPHFIRQVEEYIDKNGSDGLFCVYFDLSNFQYLNESYGYEEGDKVLKELAQTMGGGENSIFLCRVTSDQFAGLLRADSVMQAAMTYQKLASSFCQRMNQKYDLCNLVLAIGMYEINGREASVSAILDCANEARKKGKEQRVYTNIVVYNEQIRQQSESVKTILANMVPAYNNGEFYAYMQPKISLKTGKIVGAEALVRWIRRDGTRLMPDQFIDIFERNGFITKVDFCVLEQVMEYLREAIDRGEEVVPVSVNFSRRHNEFQGFVANVYKRLEEYGVPAKLLEAELTESVFLADLSTLKANITALREKGIQIAIDDFGSGYSSLNVLARVSADTIKLDKQFLRDSSEDGKTLEVMKYLIRMLKKMGYQVIAEGVETAEQVEMLKQADCDIAQGYYYAKPMPLQEFREFLQKFNHTEV